MNQDKKNSQKKPEKNPQGNRTHAPTDYKNPVGKKDEISTPKNSGYDEKQPKTS